MARYFQGNTLAAFTRNSGGCIEVTTSSGRFDPAFVANAIGLPSCNFGAEFIEGRLNADATGDVWVHYEASINAGSSGPAGNTYGHRLFNSAGVELFRVLGLASPSSSVQCQYWSGSAWVNTGPIILFPNGVQRFDFRFTPGNGGSFALYIGGALLGQGSGHVVSGVTADVRSFRLSSLSSAAIMTVSQIMCADYDLRDSRLRASAINANGALTDGTGGFADISEALLDETTAIKLTAAGQRKTFQKGAITIPAGYRIAAMGVSARARVTGALTDGQLSVRVEGDNYDGPNLGLGAGYEGRAPFILEANPATAGDWTVADYNAAEVGMEAI